MIDLGASNDITINLPKYMKELVTHWDVGEAVDMAVLIDPEDQRVMSTSICGRVRHTGAKGAGLMEHLGVWLEAGSGSWTTS